MKATARETQALALAAGAAVLIWDKTTAYGSGLVSEDFFAARELINMAMLLLNPEHDQEAKQNVGDRGRRVKARRKPTSRPRKRRGSPPAAASGPGTPD